MNWRIGWPRRWAFVILVLLSSIAAAEDQQIALDAAKAAATRDVDGKLKSITLTFSTKSRDAFTMFTSAHLGRRVEVRLAEQVLMMARIVTPITIGEMEVALDKISEGDAAEVVRKLSSQGAKIEVTVLAN